ncbi:hypothetical protein [Amphritea sp.]|uniref:tetratricopeptide repeat protein n=1 Tax=Amphritea sp. TaxID=1872502 RepID=UPI003D133D6B
MLQGLRLIIAIAIVLASSGAIAADMRQCQQAYREGKVVQAYDSCLPLAQVGEPQAAFILARLYALGVSGKGPDWVKVVEWLRISAASDHDEAAYNLAIAYQKGKGTAVDLQQSLKYYRQAAELGNPKAMRNLALLYEKGEVVEQNIPQAFSLYLGSAEAGLPDSQLKAGLMLLQGEGVEKDPVAARRWIEQSALAGNDKAQLALGVLLADFDPDTAIYWYNQAVSGGNAYAAHNLALLYAEGQGVARDLFQALAYADTSIGLGNLQTQPLYDKILADLQQSTISLQRLHSESGVITPPAPSGRGEPQPLSGSTGSNADDQDGREISMMDLNWLKAQPPERLVVQLARLTSRERAIRFMIDYNLQRIAYSVILASHDYVILLQDNFGDKADAQRALKLKLPPSLATDAWVRSFRSLYMN